jgi:chromosome condensin MukBEF complex kleisin-like MukF subunit
VENRRVSQVIKQNASLEKSPTKKVKTQCNHVFAAMIAYCKLEMLKFNLGMRFTPQTTKITTILQLTPLGVAVSI